MTMVNASCYGRHAAALVEVRPEHEVVEVEVEPPEDLEFERASYRIGWQKRKELVLQAPAEVVGTNGETVHVISSDGGVCVLSGTVELKFDESLDFYRGTVLVEARTLGAAAVVTATLGDRAARTGVKVTRTEEGPGLIPRLVPDEMGSFRGVIEPEVDEMGVERQILKISTRHKALRPYFGDIGQGQNTPMCRAIIAEVMADTAARHIVGRLFRLRRTTEEFDSDRFYREHNKRMTRLLPPIQRLLVGEPSRAWTSTELDPSPLFEG
jgi:hypothetical protein